MPRIKLEPFENVVANGQAVLTTEALWPNTLEQLVFTLGGTFTKTMIARLQVKFGTKTVVDVTGAQLTDLNEFEGRVQTATVLSLPFMNTRARTLVQQYLYAPDFRALGTRKVQILVDIVGATNPTLSAKADIVAPGLLGANGNLVFRQLYRTPLTPSAAVAEQPQQINYGQSKGARLRGLHFFSPLVTQLAIKRDGVKNFEDVPLAEQNALLTEARWVPQTNVFSWVADEDDNADKLLTSIRADGQGGSLIPQQILMWTSGAGAFDVIADVVAGLDG
jgi:hypothetical protein